MPAAVPFIMAGAAIAGLGASIGFGVKNIQMANEAADQAKKNAKEGKLLQGEMAKAQLLRAVLQPGAKTMSDVIRANRGRAAAQSRAQNADAPVRPSSSTTTTVADSRGSYPTGRG